jgi:hypothetical protein
MNRKSILAALALSAFAASASASDMRDPPVPVDTTGLLPNLSAGIQKHAAEGLRSLSRYLAIHRKYHNLVTEDVVKEPAERGASFGEKEYKRHAQEWKQAKN